MKLLPFDRFSLITLKSVEEIQTSLVEAVRKPKWLTLSLTLGPFGKRPEHRYEGAFDDHGFKIWPVIRYQNSFMPVIVGCFEPHFSGTKIAVVQRLHTFVLWFVVLWVTGVIVIGGAIIAAGEPLEGDGLTLEPKFIPVFMIVFMWVLTTGGFWWEARHTKEQLKLMFDAQELPEE